MRVLERNMKFLLILGEILSGILMKKKLFKLIYLQRVEELEKENEVIGNRMALA